MIDIAEFGTATTGTVSVTLGDVTSVNAGFDVSPVGQSGLPAMIRRREAYYWTNKWQRDEAESRAALAAGDFAEFSGDSEDPSDVIRWLFDESDDE